VHVATTHIPEIYIPEIYIPESILNAALKCTESELAAVESAKKKNGVDEFIAGSILEVLAGQGALYEANEDALTEAIEQTLDRAFTLIALCKNPVDIEEIGRRVLSLGRKQRVWDPKNNQALEARLKQAFYEIDNEYHLHIKGTNDKKMLRKKVRKAVEIIESLLNQNNVRFRHE
jgi:hypothetical protein